MKHTLLALLILASFTRTGAQTIPNAPPTLNRAQWALLTADAATRAFDVYSTQWMLAHGYRERVLPVAVASNTSALAAFSGATVALDWYIERELTRHHHRKLAVLYTAIDIGIDLPKTQGNSLTGVPRPIPHSCPGNTGICLAP
jgi:hypothetical protein